MFVLLVEVEVADGQRDAFLEAALTNAAASLRDEPGCLRFEVIADADDPLRFRFDEGYADEGAYAAHRETPHYAAWQQAAERYVARVQRRAGAVVLGEDPVAPEARVVRAGAAPVRDRGNGVRTTELVAATQLRAGVTAFDPGSGLPLHCHDCEELVRVLSGEITFATESASERLAAGDTTWVPAGAFHRFHDAGPSGAEIHFAYGRGAPTRTLATTGRTVAVGSGDDAGYDAAS